MGDLQKASIGEMDSETQRLLEKHILVFYTPTVTTPSKADHRERPEAQVQRLYQ
jgi:hypothetical protein